MMSKQQVVSELHKSARKNFIRRRVILKGIDDLWQADLIDFKNLKTLNKGFSFILIVIDCFSKYAWSVPLKTKNKTEVTAAFEFILQKSGRRPKNLQTDLGTEFYNEKFSTLMKSLSVNHYSSFSTKKASIVERLIKTIKNKLYKTFSLNGNYKWIGTPLEDVLYDYNHTNHRTIKMKPVEVNSKNEALIKQHYTLLNKEKKKKNKFKLGDFVRVSKYKNCFEKGYTPNWSTEIFKIISVNNTNPVTYHIEDQRKQKILGTFYEQELQKTLYPDIYLVEKVLKKKGDRLYVKWLGLDNSENSWIQNKTLIR